MLCSRAEQTALRKEIATYLHGQKLAIIDDEDPDYYYLGRCSITNFSNTKNIGQLTIECICEPYKIKIGSVFDVRYFSTDNLVNVLDMHRFANGSGWHYIDDNGKAILRYFYSLSYPIPILGKVGLRGTNALASPIPELNTFYLVEYDQYMRFIRKSNEILGPALMMHTTSDNCRYVVCGYGCRAGGGLEQSYPVLQFSGGSYSYKPYDTTEKTDTFSLTLDLGKEVIPEFCVCGAVTITYEGAEYKLTSGIRRILSLIMHPGENEITVTGHGSVSITYQEVSL